MTTATHGAGRRRRGRELALRVLFELEKETPVAVVIDESVELAKAYAGEEAVQFVNGVLGHVARQRV